MRIVEDFCDVNPVETILPEIQTLPLVFNSPHSGMCYPRHFLESSQLDSQTMRNSEDAYVDFLFSDAVFHGAPLIRAVYPRSFLDVNREPFELDPRMFKGRLPEYVNCQSVRVAGGLGTIARVVGNSQEIYSDLLEVDEGLERIEHIYKPYHKVLNDFLESTRKLFGYSILIDCHSMPSFINGQNLRLRPDMVIGDRFGASCMQSLVDAAERILSSMGYSVVRNVPFAGGYITENYGQPGNGVQAFQLEINRGTYLDESSLCLSNNAIDLKNDLGEFIRQLAAVVECELGNFPIAAE